MLQTQIISVCSESQIKCMNTVWAERQATSGVFIVTTLLETVKYSKFMTYQNVGYHNPKALSLGPGL